MLDRVVDQFSSIQTEKYFYTLTVRTSLFVTARAEGGCGWNFPNRIAKPDAVNARVYMSAPSAL